MAEFKIKVKNESNIKDKPRVYFTCHPRDFDAHFDRICADLFKTQDCAVYYTEDMSEELSAENLSLDINRMNLIVVPITLKLLVEDNRAMRVDIPFAMKSGIPVLPLMMEGGIVEIYSRPDRFGERQFIAPDSREESEIAYGKKLSDFLGATLTSDEVAKRVRAAFDAYIFLSYRKKDRVLANELIRLIHENPKYRDIAIWYDELLSPGESFRENITRALSDSRLFALLVTPSILEAPNFVMDEEYPAARKSGKPVLPVEMTETDKNELVEKYEQIPTPVSGSEGEAVYERLAEMLVGIAISENDDDPEHLYLIGLAYLNGIDVEVNRERGIELITRAAEAGYLYALQELCKIHCVNGNYPVLIEWAKRLNDTSSLYGSSMQDTVTSLKILAFAYGAMGDYEKSVEVAERLYSFTVDTLGEGHPDAIASLIELCIHYGNIENIIKMLEYSEKAYKLSAASLGERHFNTLNAIILLSIAHGKTGNTDKMLLYSEKAYELCKCVLGKADTLTVIALINLAAALLLSKNADKAIELNEAALDWCIKERGNDHPNTITVLSNLAMSHSEAGNPKKALEISERVYLSLCNNLGENHPETIKEIINTACYHSELGRTREAIALLRRAKTVLIKTCGRRHPLVQKINDAIYKLILIEG